MTQRMSPGRISLKDLMSNEPMRGLSDRPMNHCAGERAQKEKRAAARGARTLKKELDVLPPNASISSSRKLCAYTNMACGEVDQHLLLTPALKLTCTTLITKLAEMSSAQCSEIQSSGPNPIVYVVPPTTAKEAMSVANAAPADRQLPTPSNTSKGPNAPFILYDNLSPFLISPPSTIFPGRTNQHATVNAYQAPYAAIPSQLQSWFHHAFPPITPAHPVA